MEKLSKGQETPISEEPQDVLSIFQMMTENDRQRREEEIKEK